MAFTEKKTRIRRLPPKLQIIEESSLTGSYSFKSRGGAVVDNRTGIFVTPFNDQSTTQVFPATSSVPSLNYTSSLTSVPYIPGQDLRPFRDFDQYAADETAKVNNSFWATGSSVETFGGPLWSKNKIEIDITPSAQTGITASDNDGYEVAFNFNTKTWQASSYGSVPADVVTVPKKYEEVNYAFSPSYHPHVSNYDLRSRGKPISNFGFPSLWNIPEHFTYHMSQVIDRPFILEKVLVEVSVSYIKGAGARGAFSSIPDLFLDGVDYDGYNLYGPSSVLPQVSNSYVVNNFFILNKKKTARKDLIKLRSYETDSVLDFYTFVPTQTKNSYDGAELVTWFEIASFNDNYGYVTQSLTNPSLFYRDVTIVDSSSRDAFFSSWSNNLKMSGSVRVPNLGNILDPNASTIFDYQGLALRYLTAGWLGGRDGLDDTSHNGRDFFRAKKNANSGSTNQETYTESPYLLLPTDKLSFRWQMPIPESQNSFIFNPNPASIPSSSYVVFPVSKAKVVLYGSFISNGEAVNNNTLNQLLSSENIHEDIE